jgi:hypothetical protein
MGRVVVRPGAALACTEIVTFAGWSGRTSPSHSTISFNPWAHTALRPRCSVAHAWGLRAVEALRDRLQNFLLDPGPFEQDFFVVVAQNGIAAEHQGPVMGNVAASLHG